MRLPQVYKSRTRKKKKEKFLDYREYFKKLDPRSVCLDCIHYTTRYGFFVGHICCASPGDPVVMSQWRAIQRRKCLGFIAIRRVPNVRKIRA